MTYPVLDPGRWFRVGSGRRRELPGLSIGSVEQALDGLPAEYGPYVVVAHELVLSGQRNVSRSWVVRGREMRDRVDRGVWQYFIVSAALSPGLLSRLPDVDVQTLVVNGAINLQVGRRTSRGAQPPSLGMVPRVSTEQGDVHEHEQYADIFEALVRQLRKSA